MPLQWLSTTRAGPKGVVHALPAMIPPRIAFRRPGNRPYSLHSGECREYPSQSASLSGSVTRRASPAGRLTGVATAQEPANLTPDQPPAGPTRRRRSDRSCSLTPNSGG